MPPGSQRPVAVALALLTVSITLIAYSPSMGGGFIWDDDDYVTENPTLRDVGGLVSIWADPTATPQYYPLVHSSFWVEYQLWGLKPLGYHLDNVLIHLIGSLLLWRLLHRLQVPGGWLAATIFAIHPVHVESVAWITERKNVLSGMFTMLAALSFLRFYNFARLDEDPRPRWRWYLAAFAAFIAAMLSKTVAATFPAALLVLMWWKTGTLRRRWLIWMSPFLIVGVGMGLITAWLEKSQVGAQGVDWQLSPIERCLIAGRAICFYASKLLYPVPLIFNYERWSVDDTQVWQYGYPAAVLIALISLFVLRHRIGRGPFATLALFCGLLFPALGFIDVYPFRFSFVADHFQYLASTALIAGVTAMVVSTFGRTDPADRYLPRWWLQRSLPGLYLVFLAALTFRQGFVYEGLEPLWRDTLQKNPDSFLAGTNLGAILNRRGEATRSEPLLRRAIEIKADFPDTYVNLGKSLELQGRLEEAEATYRRATEVGPGLAAAWNGLAAMLGTRGDYAGAEEAFLRAQSLNPGDINVAINLATLYVATEKPILAASQYQRILQLDPNHLPAHKGQAELAARVGDFGAAEKSLRTAYELAPQDIETLFGLGAIAAMQQRWPEAIDYYQQVLRLQPTLGQARANLAAALQADGQDEAARQQQEILQSQANATH